ncbi:MAG: hypothetical protein SVR08_03605 [Spirochaetota bacterium]|nr:hypothetical protein [Spirochaetota bacterium]
MANIDNLKNALKSFSKIDNDDILTMLALILEFDFKADSTKSNFTFGELEKRFMVKGHTRVTIKDALGWAAQWRLILPSWRKDLRSSCWEDRREILTKPNTRYEVLRVVQYFVANAIETGIWDAKVAVKNAFSNLTNISGELALNVLTKIATVAEEDYREEMQGDFPYYFLPIVKLKEIFKEFKVDGSKNADFWVVELKAIDIMTPEVNALYSKDKEGFGFELNTSIILSLRNANL